MHDKAIVEEKASLFQVIRMVLWTMIGVRGQKGYEEDIAKITPKQAITAGVIGAIIFIFTVVLLVNLAINYLG
jgi:DUF2970 family protein